MERLDKHVSNRTGYTRSDVKQLLKKGSIRVDGRPETDGSRKIDPDTQEIICEGKRLPMGEHFYYLLNKPMGVICATEDKTHRTVMEFLPKGVPAKGIFPAGRLDADSTGMVLLTDDGVLAHRMLSPKHHVPKYYLVRLARPYEERYAQQFAEGLKLSDGTACLPAEIRKADAGYALVCLHEGKYHQVRRMLAAVGNHVEALHRVAIGGLVLPPGLESGSCLELFHKDVERMLKYVPTEGLCEQIMKNFSSYLINDCL